MGSSGVGLFLLVELAIIGVMIAGMWKVFVKAGEPGWAVLVPFYNAYIFLKIAGKPGWWLVLFLIPIVNFIVAVIALISFAKKFGKGGGFVAGLIFLPFVFYPILGFGDAQYTATA